MTNHSSRTIQNTLSAANDPTTTHPNYAWTQGTSTRRNLIRGKRRYNSQPAEDNPTSQHTNRTNETTRNGTVITIDNSTNETTPTMKLSLFRLKDAFVKTPSCYALLILITVKLVNLRARILTSVVPSPRSHINSRPLNTGALCRISNEARSPPRNKRCNLGHLEVTTYLELEAEIRALGSKFNLHNLRSAHGLQILPLNVIQHLPPDTTIYSQHLSNYYKKSQYKYN